MWDALRSLDRILRGEATRLSSLRRGTIDVPLDGLSLVIVVLGMLYGLCMGCFTLFNQGQAALFQILASAIKIPALFLLTLAVTFPSLYVFNALVGSRLSLLSLLRLLVAALAVMVALVASFGPIVAFFSASSTSYEFMMLLNVLVFSIAGLLGLKFLLLTLHRLTIAQTEPVIAEPIVAEPSAAPSFADVEVSQADAATAEPSGALEALDGQVLGRDVRTVFRIWVIVFGMVGAQMAWVLRPFIGAPGLAFAFFRPRESNFFEAVFRAIGHLFS